MSGTLALQLSAVHGGPFNLISHISYCKTHIMCYRPYFAKPQKKISPYNHRISKLWLLTHECRNYMGAKFSIA